MTPRKDQLTPQAAINWLRQIFRGIRGGDAETKYKVRYMFTYIEKLIQYQEAMPPIVDPEDNSRFTCRRCNETMAAEAGTANDYNFCPLCGQRWKETEKLGA